jgi:ATP-dependent DNA helicase RecQ
MGGSDEPSNLVALCDGCHASHHPNLAGGLARRALEYWAVRLALWLDRQGAISEARHLGPALRLFGLRRFRSGQLPIVLPALSGKSVLVVSPTGSGKTLCFQLPAVLRHRVSLVVSPLKALMAEQVSDLLRKKIPATFINSDLSQEEKHLRFGLLAKNAVKLLYIAPERFFVRSSEERARLKQTDPSFFVVDEAHCVDQWGRDFRPEYGRLREVREKLGSPPVLAFTATAGRDMQRRILSSMGVEDATVFVRDVDRPNIALLRWACRQEQRSQEIANLLRLQELRGQRAMIFVPSVRVGEELKQALAALDIDIPLYHSRVGTAWERQELAKRFLGQSKPAVDQIICTNAFGMGLDLPNVRLVIHWQQPASVEDLLQEYGRAGRDGKPSVSVVFHDVDRNSRDVSRLKFMAERTVGAAALEQRDRATLLQHRFGQIDGVARLLRSSSCFRQSITSYFESSSARGRRRISERILEWVFGDRARRPRFSACCDVCDAREIRGRGRLNYTARIIASYPPSRAS